MNITLIAPITFDFGVYTIAPQLKAKGHKVNILFIPSLMTECYALKRFSKKIVNRICEFLKLSDLVGINCLSENYHKTAVLADFIRNRVNKPIIWGGIHATLRPQDCIKHADIVCVGEGEEAIIELTDKMTANAKIGNIRNLIIRSGNMEVKDVQLRPPIDLNTLLPFDYNLGDQYVIEGERIRNVEEKDFNGNFITYSSRGCPFRCSYCCNSTILNKTYKEKKYCRQRNIDNIIEELKIIKNKFASCKSIWFNEADFLHGKDQDVIDEFSMKYKKEIDIPFYVWTNPASVKERSIRSLVAAGFKGTNIGTINANPEIQKNVYNRTATTGLYKQAARILKENRVSVEYDFILCNPYEDENHIIKNIELLRSLPLPFKTVIYSLTYFPETELFRKAVKDGIIDGKGQVYSYIEAAYKVWFFKNKTIYLNGVASMMRGYACRTKISGIKFYGLLPDFVLRILISKPFVKLFSLSIFRVMIYPLIGFFIKVIYAILIKTSHFFKSFLRRIQK